MWPLLLWLTWFKRVLDEKEKRDSFITEKFFWRKRGVNCHIFLTFAV